MWHASGLPTSLAGATGQAQAVGDIKKDVQVRLVPVPTPRNLPAEGLGKRLDMTV